MCGVQKAGGAVVPSLLRTGSETAVRDTEPCAGPDTGPERKGCPGREQGRHRAQHYGQAARLRLPHNGGGVLRENGSGGAGGRGCA